MKVLMVDVDGVLIHGRPADGLPLFTYLERDLGLRPAKSASSTTRRKISKRRGSSAGTRRNGRQAPRLPGHFRLCVGRREWSRGNQASRL